MCRSENLTLRFFARFHFCQRERDIEKAVEHENEKQ